MSQALEPLRKRQIRLPVGLLLSIGSEKPERGPGRAIDHFRPKPGQLDQYATEAARFTEVYGAEPKEFVDCFFLSNEVPAVFDVRLLAFSQSGIRGVGDTNFAALMDESEFEDKVFGAGAYRDGFTFFPKDVSEVRPEDREKWEGEPVHGELDGRSDARVERLDIKYVASLEFCLPEIMGLGKVARISTSGRASTRNLYKSLWTQQQAFGGQLEGIPFRLAIRPRSTQRFEKKEKKFVSTTVFELVLDTPHTVAELRKAIESHRRAFGLPSPDQMRAEGRALRSALALPAGEGEEQTREEVVAETPDWLLNKIAHLEAELPEEALRPMLLGVFGVEASADLDPEQAERYWSMLEAALPAEAVEGEVVNGDEEIEGSAPESDATRHERPDSAASVSDSAVGADSSAEAGLAAGASEKRPSATDAPASADEPEVETSPSDTASSGTPGDSSVTAGAGLGDDAPAPSASDPLPGEPAPEGYVDPLDVAAGLECPIGTNRGTKIGDLSDDYVKWALQNGRHFANYSEFYSGLEFHTQHRRVEVWAEVRG